MSDSHDRYLGTDRAITRRDLMNGPAMVIGAAMLPDGRAFSATNAPEPQNQPGYDPARKTGLRGSHPGSFEIAHSLRDGTFWDSAGKPIDTGEAYDLVIAGGGISGLAAAHLFRERAGTSARILILENHDDFGGHAKRNELHRGGRLQLLNGGTFLIDSPTPYSKVADGLLKNLESIRHSLMRSSQTVSSIVLWACSLQFSLIKRLSVKTTWYWALPAAAGTMKNRRTKVSVRGNTRLTD